MQGFDPDIPVQGTATNPDEIRNNFLSLFTSNSGPSIPATSSFLAGALFYDTLLKRLSVNNGVAFQSILANWAHAELANLQLDDHTQYLLVSGARSAQGITVATGFKLDGVDISDIASGYATLHNLLLDGGFDAFNTDLTDTPPGWLTTGVATYDTDIAAAGEDGFSLKITGTGAEAGVSQVVTIKPNRRYTLSFFHKTSSGNQSRIKIYADNTTPPTTLLSQTDYADNTYTLDSIEFTTNKKYVKIDLLCETTIGSCWYDEVQLQEGDAVLSETPFAVSLGKTIRTTSWRDTDTVTHTTGEVYEECGLTTVNISAQVKEDVTINFAEPFLKFLAGCATIYTDTAEPVIAYMHSGTTNSVKVGVRAASGNTITQNHTVSWIVRGIK